MILCIYALFFLYRTAPVEYSLIPLVKDIQDVLSFTSIMFVLQILSNSQFNCFFHKLSRFQQLLPAWNGFSAGYQHEL